MSTKFSVAAMFGLAAIPLLPQLAASSLSAGFRADTPAPVASSISAAPSPEAAPAAPIAVVRSKPVPIIENRASEGEVQVARRRRERGERERDSDKQNNAPRSERKTPSENPASATVDVDKSTTPPADSKIPSEPKPDAAQAEPPKPDVWSDAEVIGALRECVKVLAPIAAEVELAPPVKQDQCGAAAPVMVRRIGSGPNRVDINPPAMVNCAMVSALYNWVEKTLQPIAHDTLGTSITRLRSASGYACRNRNGSKHNADRLSEHALANAVDIAGFITADGRDIEVAHSWGTTARDARQAAEKAAALAKENGSKSETREDPTIRRPSGIAHKAGDQPKGRDTLAMHSAELQKLGRGTADVPPAKAIPAPPAREAADVRNTAESQFLHRLHKGACGMFGTVLGPEANEAHRDHFHLDLAPRRHRAFCE